MRAIVATILGSSVIACSSPEEVGPSGQDQIDPYCKYQLELIGDIVHRGVEECRQGHAKYQKAFAAGVSDELARALFASADLELETCLQVAIKEEVFDLIPVEIAPEED